MQSARRACAMTRSSAPCTPRVRLRVASRAAAIGTPSARARPSGPGGCSGGRGGLTLSPHPSFAGYTTASARCSCGSSPAVMPGVSTGLGAFARSTSGSLYAFAGSGERRVGILCRARCLG